MQFFIFKKVHFEKHQNLFRIFLKKIMIHHKKTRNIDCFGRKNITTKEK